MLELNGKKFAKDDKEFTSSLFQSGGTCIGYYKPYSKHIVLLDHKKNKIGVVTCHKVLAVATKQSNGQYWYSYGDIELIGKYSSYMKKVNEIIKVLSDNNIVCSN